VDGEAYLVKREAYLVARDSYLVGNLKRGFGLMRKDPSIILRTTLRYDFGCCMAERNSYLVNWRSE